MRQCWPLSVVALPDGRRGSFLAGYRQRRLTRAVEQTHARESAGEGKDEAEREGNERKRRTNRSLVFFSFSLGHYTHTHTHTPAPSALRPHAAPASPASRHPPLSLKVRAAPAACAQRRSARESGRERTDKTPPFPFRSSFRLSPLRLRLRRAEGSAPRVHCRVPWARPVVCSERGGGRGGREGCWQEGARCFPFSPFRSPLFPLFSLFSLLAFSVRLSSLALRLPTHSSPSHHCAAVVVCAQGERCLWRTALWFSRPVGFFFSSLSSAARPVFYLAAAASRPALRRPP